ncbi:urease accessory protein UreF [Marasmius fiardii PR-910]|nr:urease accessory protein UreF [Marasmius fiardii PR-910]
MALCDDDETYLLLLLADSNLPTGSFVASAGLESYLTHAFKSTISFLEDSVSSYARSALPFVSDAHRIVSRYRSQRGPQGKVLADLTALDNLYESMTLNHVARRASRSQGVALLTLYSKAFSHKDKEKDKSSLVAEYKLLIRREETPGHLPICWAILTGALGLTLARSQYLHIFLHARSLLSASVRLNDLGPYNAQHVLLHTARSIISVAVVQCENIHTGMLVEIPDEEQDEQGPANTWPLGEILASRHDLQHSRIFNS